MLLKAKERGAQRFELFSNSPMWWMCKNHNPSGADDGGESLTSWNITQHAIYLSSIAKYAADNWGVNFESVEPFNEPMGGWWKSRGGDGSEGTSEGCHVERSTQVSIIHALRAELDARGLWQTTISASDENSYAQATATWLSFNDSTHA